MPKSLYAHTHMLRYMHAQPCSECVCVILKFAPHEAPVLQTSQGNHMQRTFPFYYPDSILVFWKLFVGFASDGGDSNTETAPCLGTSHLTKEGHTPLPNHRTAKLLQLRLSGSVYCFSHLRCALIFHL